MAHESRMPPDDFGIDIGDEVSRRDVANAKWSIMFNGFLLPVTDLIDSRGENTENPFHAVRAVAFSKHETRGNWFVIAVEPGDVTVRSKADVQFSSYDKNRD